MNQPVRPIVTLVVIAIAGVIAGFALRPKELPLFPARSDPALENRQRVERLQSAILGGAGQDEDPLDDAAIELMRPQVEALLADSTLSDFRVESLLHQCELNPGKSFAAAHVARLSKIFDWDEAETITTGRAFAEFGTAAREMISERGTVVVKGPGEYEVSLTALEADYAALVHDLRVELRSLLGTDVVAMERLGLFGGFDGVIGSDSRWLVQVNVTPSGEGVVDVAHEATRSHARISTSVGTRPATRHMNFSGRPLLSAMDWSAAFEEAKTRAREE